MFSAEAKNILIVDSFFCDNKNIQYKSLQKLESKCGTDRKFHGDLVLKTILKYADKPKDQLTFYLHRIYLENGLQDQNLINDLPKLIKDIKIDLAVFATGIYLSPPNIDLNFPLIVSSGSLGNGVTAQMKLWPQQNKKENMVMVAHYFASKLNSKLEPKGYLESTLLNPELIDYYIENPSSSLLKGSSFASAYLAGNVIKFCNLNNLKDCFKKYSKNLEVLNPYPSLKSYSTLRFR